MSHLSRKFVAVMMLLWLPLFSGNALAASLSMQLQHGQDDAAGMAQMMMAQEDMDSMMSGDEHHCDMTNTTDDHSQPCGDCELCHLACTGYLAVPGTELVALQTAARETTPYLLAFHSHISAPLVPPPLVRA